MSTQRSEFPPVQFSITQPFSHVRLLEVPKEVLDIIAKGETLSFKSASSLSAVAGVDNTKEGFLHLCSHNRAWAVKQVSTSNSVYITRQVDRVSREGTETTANGNGHDDESMDIDTDNSASESAITAFAKPTNILELYEVPSDNFDSIVREHLYRIVPTYHYSPELEEQQRPSDDREVHIEDILNGIPAPNAAIERVMAYLCAFHISGAYYIPSEAALLAAWKAVVEACTSEGSSVSEVGDGPSVITLLATDQPHLDAVIILIAKAMWAENGLFDLLGLRQEGTRLLVEMDTARWAGNLLLAQDKNACIGLVSFISQWEDIVPAAWFKYCSIEVLGNLCEVKTMEDGKEGIQWKAFSKTMTTGHGSNSSAATSASAPSGAGSSNNTKSTSNSTVASGKRKWHEKFAAQRNVKK